MPVNCLSTKLFKIKPWSKGDPGMGQPQPSFVLRWGWGGLLRLCLLLAHTTAALFVLHFL